MNTNSTAVAKFTTQNDFDQFLDVGSTPELETIKVLLQRKISDIPGNVRSTLKDLYEARLTAIRQELSVR